MSISSAFNGLIQALLRLLPASPFAPYVAQFASLPYLGYVNWFLPIGTMLHIMEAWLIAVGLFYAYSVVARWVKLIGD